MMKLRDVILFFVFPFAAYLGFFSLIARARQIALWPYWAGSLAAVTPWTVVTIIVVVSSSFLPQKLQQAGGMAGMFPMFGVLGALFLSPIVSLFLRSEVSLTTRVKWIGLTSLAPALGVLAFILFVFINDSRGNS